MRKSLLESMKMKEFGSMIIYLFSYLMKNPLNTMSIRGTYIMILSNFKEQVNYPREWWENWIVEKAVQSEVFVFRLLTTLHSLIYQYPLGLDMICRACLVFSQITSGTKLSCATVTKVLKHRKFRTYKIQHH